MSEPTPRPWRIEFGDVVAGEPDERRMILFLADDTRAADRDLIVRAVNAHDSLRIALIGMVKQFGADRPLDNDCSALKAARAALAACEEPPCTQP